MRPFPRIRVTLAVGLTLLTACGTTIRPHVSVGGDGRPPGAFPGGRLDPRPDEDRANAEYDGRTIDQVCRTQAARPGWLATRYLEGAENCPRSTDAENRYNVAVIERYSHLQVGTTLVVCADQPIPRDWVRERNQEVRSSCEGARVKDGEPTVMMIRRIGSR